MRKTWFTRARHGQGEETSSPRGGGKGVRQGGRALVGLVALLPFLVLSGCDSNPTLAGNVDGNLGEDLEVSLTVTPDHAHILETPVLFHVEIRDRDGHPATDFEAVHVERQLHGETTWRAVECEPVGDAFEGSYTFATSGEYELRVAVLHHGETETEVLYEHPDHLGVARAHVETGGYRIEFETFPGHIHEGDEVTLRFWAMEVEKDADGHRHAIEGLGGQVHMSQTGGEDLLLDATEVEPGVYEATVPFALAGEAHAGFHFTGADAGPAEAEFHLHVAHGH